MKANHRKIRFDKKALITAIILTLVIGISYVYYYNHTVINDGLFFEINFNNYIYQIEEVSVLNGELNIYGWCFNREEELANYNEVPNMRIILVDLNEGHRKYFNADYGLVRTDVNDYFNSNIDYSFCGFEAHISTETLDNENNQYEIYIQQNSRNEVTIGTGMVLDNDKVVYLEQNNKSLLVGGTDLEEIIINGIPRAYREDMGVYIYQYDWKLYYIIDNNYPVEKGWLSLACNIGTNSPEVINNESSDYGYEVLGFDFIEHEITNLINSGDYRVAVLELPTTYPVMLIDTGFWTVKDEWVWRSRFCPGLPTMIRMLDRK